MKSITERIAVAPISWGVSEVATWGHQMAARRVFDEMRTLGFRASELGPNGYFANDKQVARDVKTGGFEIIAGFVPTTFRFPGGLSDSVDSLHETFARLSGSGAEFVVLAIGSDGDDYESRPRLHGGQWNEVAASIELVSEIAATNDLKTVFHPHYGTFIDGAEDTRKILEKSSVGLCLDTGHIALAGDDPVDLLRDAVNRVEHVHLKDVDYDLAERVREGRISYHDAVKQGLYPPLGGGGVRFEEFIAKLEDSGYDGWYVLEQDMALDGEPEQGGGPLLSVKASMDYLARLDEILGNATISPTKGKTTNERVA